MKKILFAAVTLDIGGIETALITLINYLAKNNYKITLVLEKKQGVFLDILDKNIDVIEFTPSKNKNILFRKTINFFKQVKFKIKYKNKFDFSCVYATYSIPASFVARVSSNNSVLWCHMDYLEQFKGNKKEVVEFFKEKKYKEFRNLVFVSKQSRDSFLKVFPNMKNKTVYINNLIDYKAIIEKSNEKVEDDIKNHINNKEIVFVNISRHDEKQKKISRIIEASKMLKDDNIKFKVLLVGDGKDTEKYKLMVKEYNLDKYIIFLGRKKNPYPYYKIANCILLTSDYEGSPVIFTEAMILKKTVITTEVAGSIQIKDKYGFIVKKDSKDIYLKMKKFIKDGYKVKEEFDPEKYNIEIIKKLEEIL